MYGLRFNACFDARRKHQGRPAMSGAGGRDGRGSADY